MRNQILAYALKYHGEYFKIKQAIDNQEAYLISDYPGDYLCIGDSDYPSLLYDLTYPPYILFFEGNLELLKLPALSIVGSRNCSSLGKSYCEELYHHCNKQYVSISGLAKGIDAYIHELWLTSRNTIGIIGCGLDVYYPKSSQWLYDAMKHKHLILSEYPNGTPPLAYHFPWRNRLIAALGHKLIVIEAGRYSGTMHSVNEALELDREVHCFPHPYFAQNATGNHLLIQEGASIIVDKLDLKEL